MNIEKFKDYKFTYNIDLDLYNILFMKIPIDIKWSENPIKILKKNCDCLLIDNFETEKYKFYCLATLKNVQLGRFKYDDNFEAFIIQILLKPDSKLYNLWISRCPFPSITKDDSLIFRDYIFPKNQSLFCNYNFICWDDNDEIKSSYYLQYKNKISN
jgi:hypothetical protein